MINFLARMMWNLGSSACVSNYPKPTSVGNCITNYPMISFLHTTCTQKGLVQNVLVSIFSLYSWESNQCPLPCRLINPLVGPATSSVLAAASWALMTSFSVYCTHAEWHNWLIVKLSCSLFGAALCSGKHRFSEAACVGLDGVKWPLIIG